MESFNIFVPEILPESQYAISGADCQVLSISLQPGDFCDSEPGVMMMMSPNIKTTVGCGSCSRVCTGEGHCKTYYTNSGSEPGFVSISPHFPGKVIPIDLSKHNGKFVAKPGAYISAVGDTKVVCNVDCNPLTACCGGWGCVRQGLEGSGTAFVGAGGTILEKTLGADEVLVVDSFSIVGFADTVTFGVRCAGSPTGACFAGEGCCNSTVKGPGHIILQSMSYEKWHAAVAPPPGDVVKYNMKNRKKKQTAAGAAGQAL